MGHRGRVAAVVAALLVAAGLGGCSLFGLDPGEPITCEDDGAPATAPGEAAVTLVVAEGTSAWDRTLVVYADGNVATLQEADAVLDAALDIGAVATARMAPGPYVAAPGSWQRGYLNACAMEELHPLAQDALWGDPDVGRPHVTDQPTTFFHYTDGGSATDVAVYAHDSGFRNGLSWSERRARDELSALTEFLDVNVVETAEVLPVTALQVDGAATDISPGFSWPAPHPRELLAQTGCAGLTGDVAQAAYAHMLDAAAAGELAPGVWVRALPPGVAPCT